MADNNNNDIKYHSQDQRKHYRLTTPFWIKIEGKTYKTTDWSVGGLAIDNYHRDVAHGESIPLKILIKFQGFNVGFDADSKALGVTDGKLRLKFEELSDRSKNILQFFSQSIISGEMADIEDTIKRIDMPINIKEDAEAERSSNKGPIHRWPAKTLFFTILYLTLGLVLLLYLFFLVYSNFVHMKVESAVVSAPTETIVSPFSGNVDKVFVEKGSLVTRDQPMYRLKDHDLDHRLELAKAEKESAEALHELKSKHLDTEKNKIEIYATIGKAKLDEAESTLQEWEERHENVFNEHQRALKLFEKKVISKSEMDQREAEYETVMHQLAQAKHQLKVSTKSVKSTEEGHYFSNDRLEGDIPQHVAVVEHAKRQMDVEKTKIEAIQKQIDLRTIRSPFDGHIVDVFKSRGNTVSRGDDLLLIERDENRIITAFLTQDEIVEIKLGTRVRVYVPSLEKNFDGRVKKIDRTDGFIDEVNSDYRPRTMNDRSGKVSIELENFNMEDARKYLHPGTPVIVYFDRSMFKAIWHRIRLHTSPADSPGQAEKAQQIKKVEAATKI